MSNAAKQEKHCKQRQKMESVRRTGYLLDLISKGVDPTLAAQKLERRKDVGNESERIALEAFKESPLVASAERAPEVDDQNRDIDIFLRLKEEVGGHKIHVQVKASEGGKADYLVKSKRQFGKTNNETAADLLVKTNRMVVVAGINGNETKRKEQVQAQLDTWVERKKSLSRW